MFKKKSNKSTVKPQTEKPASKAAKAQAGKPASKAAKAQTGKPVSKTGATQAKPGKKTAQAQDQSDKVLNKLMAIEKETRLKQVRDNVDHLEDEKIAEHIELLLKIMRSGD